MALSEEQIVKLIAISPDIMSEDSPGGTNVTGDEMVSALGLEGESQGAKYDIGEKKNPYWSEISRLANNHLSIQAHYGKGSHTKMQPMLKSLENLPTIDGKLVLDHPDFLKFYKEQTGENLKWRGDFSKVYAGHSTGIMQRAILNQQLAAANLARQWLDSSNVSSEDIISAIDERELTMGEKRNLMLRRFPGLGINDYNNWQTGVQAAVKGLLGKDIDEQSAALFVANDPSNAGKLRSEWIRNGQAGDISEIDTSILVDNGATFSVSPDSVSSSKKMMTPYDFENGSKFYGESTFINGKRVENENFYSAAKVPGWSEHPVLGSIYSPNVEDDNSWKYSYEYGWVSTDDKNGSNWFFLKDSNTWMYPQQTENGVFFYSKEPGSAPGEGEWYYPNSTGQLYDFETKEFFDPEELGAKFESEADPADIMPDADTSLDTSASQINDPTSTNMSENNKWYEDEYGAYYYTDTPGWRYRYGDKLRGFFYDDPNSRFMWSEKTGWIWNDPDESGDYFYHNASGEWAYAKEIEGQIQEPNFVTSEGQPFDFTLSNEDSPNEPPASSPGDSDSEVAKPISYANMTTSDPIAGFTQIKKELDAAARELAYEGYDQGMISGMLKELPIYKKFVRTFSNDPERERYAALVDDIVNQVAEVNVRKHNLATSLDFADARGLGMLDPRFSPEEKIKIRLAKPSIPATEVHVAQGLADEVGQIIKNPDYDPELSMYFEYRNPVTGELETRAHRQGMPGKAPFAAIQEGVIDSSTMAMQDQLNDLMAPTENGKSKYQNALDKQINAFRDAGIMAGGEDDPSTPENESLGLYANEGIKALNYTFGTDEDSMQGKEEDYNEMQKYLRGKTNFLSNLALKDELDKTSRFAAAQEDFDPIERARQRAVDRTRIARFGGGTTSIRDTSKGLFEDNLKEKLAFKDLSAISGLGETYSQDEINAAGIQDGAKGMPVMSDMLKQNQYSKNINDTKSI